PSGKISRGGATRHCALARDRLASGDQPQLKPMTTKSPLRVLAACTAALVVATGVRAQKSTNAPTPSSSGEEVVTLSVFEVSTDRDTAYRANNAVSSNRSNTSIFDTPQSITVLTDSFLRDIEALSVAEALEFIPGVTPGDAGAGGADQIQVRGQAIPETLLDNMPDLNTNVRPDP